MKPTIHDWMGVEALQMIHDGIPLWLLDGGGVVMVGGQSVGGLSALACISASNGFDRREPLAVFSPCLLGAF